MAAAHFLILYLPILLSLHLCLFSCCLPLNYLLYFHVPFFNFYHSFSISIAQQSFYLGSTFSFSLYFYAFCLSLSISLSLLILINCPFSSSVFFLTLPHFLLFSWIQFSSKCWLCICRQTSVVQKFKLFFLLQEGCNYSS